jgi:hypothetical protein
MKNNVSFLLCSHDKKDLNCFELDKYVDLAKYLQEKKLSVNTITWKKDNIDELYKLSDQTDALLVWVDPLDRDIENGLFEKYLRDMKAKGKYISSNPDTVLKIGTKKVLFDLSGTRWVSDVFLHHNISTFFEIGNRIGVNKFRILKQLRGNGGNGVYKVGMHEDNKIFLIEANTNNELIFENIHKLSEHIIKANTQIIETAWNDNLVNGVLRCYFCNSTIVGFGYQEINALYPLQYDSVIKKQRFYLTENCGIFKNIKNLLESDFVEDILVKLGVNINDLPLIWDADFFINNLLGENIELCEINSSCVSPYPLSAIKYMHKEIEKNLTTAST